MGQSNLPYSLAQLIAYCCDSNSPYREAAWREFLKQYKIIIYQYIIRRCLTWQASRLKRQLSDVVNDIVSEVLMILYKSLSTYREVEDEAKFKLWLGTICNRAASRHLRQEFLALLVEPDVEEFNNYIYQLEFESRWELYESVVHHLRGLNIRNRQNIERDINIFQLYTWADLPQSIIESHPCYSNIGHRVVDNVVNRMRDHLRTKKN